MTSPSKDWMKVVASKAAATDPVPGAVIPPREPGLVMHLDGDYLAYFASGSDECEPGQARWNALNKIESMRSMSGADQVLVHLTSSGSNKGQRYFIATEKPYQGQRSSSRRPKNWEFLRTWLESYSGPAFEIVTWHNREADDGIAYAACQEYSVIAAADKDMRMLPGRHVNWKTYQLTEVPPDAYRVVGPDDLEYGTYWFWKQLLMGDTADNIPGLPGYYLGGKLKRIGEAGATKALSETTSNSDAFRVCRILYETYYGKDWDQAMAEQAALLWLRRDAEADIADLLRVFPPKVMNHAVNALKDRVRRESAEADAITGASSQGQAAG